MRGRATRVAVVQLDCHPAAVLPGLSEPLEDPLFGGQGETLPTPDAVADLLVEPIRALRTRVREAYCAQLLQKVTAILEACRGWGVQLVLFPEYSIPWQILDGVAATSGEMVVVAGTHAVTRAAHTDGVYQRLGGVPPPALEAVAPVLHHGKLLALTSKMHAARPERGALRESERWSTIELPPDLGLPSPLGVVICLDFLVAPGAEPDKVTRDKLQQARLLAVPSWTPTHTLREFEAAAWVSAARGRTPVLYANVTAHGGSTIYVDQEHGHEAGRFPQQIGRLDAGDEGVVVVDVDLSDQRRGTLTQFLDRQIVTPIAQASLVYRSHPAGAAYAAWLEAQAPALANGDNGLDDVLAAIKANAAILRSAGALPGAAARGLRLRSLLNYPEGLNRIEDVACRVREVVLPADVVTHGFVRAAMALGAGQAIDDLLLRGELRGQQRELVAIRDRLQAGGKAASQRTEAEWTEAGRDALAAITAAVRGEVPVAPAPVVRLETRPLPAEIQPVALADRTVTIDGQAHELVFRARASEVVAALYRPLHRDAEGARELGRVRSGSSDVLAVDRLVALLRAEGATHLAVVGLGPDEVKRAALSHPNVQGSWAELSQQVPAGKPYEISPLVPLAVVARVSGACRLYRIALGDARQELGIRVWQPREEAGLDATVVELGLGKSSWIEVSAEEIATRIERLRPVLGGARDVIIGLRDRRLREVGGHYVDPDIAVDDRSGPARDVLDGWLDPEAPPHNTADKPIALVLGEFGAGKSTLLADWCLHRWRDRSDGPRPILIDLAGAGEQADALALVLGGCGLADTPAHRAAMALLISAGHAVPCFDGFDEMATRLQASALGGRLAALTSVVADGGHAVVSSRSNYFPNASAEQELERALASSLAQSAPHTRMEVQAFDDAKVRRLVTDVVGPERASDVLGRIQTTYDLRDLAKRPLLLGMVLQTLEQLPPGKRVTQAVLYEQYLARWLANTHVGEREAFTDLQKRAFAETLAEALWRTGATSLGWEALQDTVRARLFRELPEDVPPGAALLEIAGGAFFVREGDDRYRFAHKSFLEYFFARALVRGLAAGSTRGLDTRPLSPEVIAFVSEVLLLEASEAPERHLAVVVVQSWLTTGRGNEGELGTTASTAANAVRLLHGLAREAKTAGWIPDGADLRAVNLDGEDLSGAELRQARLEGAQLRAARLVSAVLDGAQLAHAVLDEAVLDGATLAGARAPSASFVRASAREADLRGADVRGANLAQSQWVDCRWAGARWAEARTESAIFVGAEAPVSAATELLARVCAGHGGWVRSVAWRGDGTRLASGAADGTVRVWDPHKPVTPLALYTGHTFGVCAVCTLHLDGQSIVASASVLGHRGRLPQRTKLRQG
jgi:predicted amidohydrolase